MIKDFDEWNKVKKMVNANELRADFFYHQREVWWCAIGLNIDVETDGKQVNIRIEPLHKGGALGGRSH